MGKSTGKAAKKVQEEELEEVEDVDNNSKEGDKRAKKVSAPKKSAKAGKDDAAEKKAKRKSHAASAGIEISVSHVHRAISRCWKGKVSGDAAIIAAALLQFVAEKTFKGAAAAASKGQKPVKDGEKASIHRISSGDVQASLTANRDLFRQLVKGSVMGTAPNTRKATDPAVVAAYNACREEE